MLIGNTDEEKIMLWFLNNTNLPKEAIAGILGNCHAESHLRSNNVQNSFEKRYNWTDETYTQGVDSGNIDFINPSCGYGLFQWTYYTRKQALLKYAQDRKVSIGDLEMQLNFFYLELTSNYRYLYNKLMYCKDVQEASDLMLTKFERPADTGDAVKKKRGEYSAEYYNKLKGITPKVGMNVLLDGKNYVIKRVVMDSLFISKNKNTHSGFWISTNER